MCVFSFGSRFAHFGRYVIDRQNALHRIFWSKTSFSFRTVASSHCAIRCLRRSLAAVLLSLPLLFGLTVPDEAYAQTSCNVSTAITTAEGAFDHHRQNSAGKGPVATATYRALIALGDTSLPTWTGGNISGAAPTTPISEAGLRTVLTNQNEIGQNSWSGWTTILNALNCLEAALPAVTITSEPNPITDLIQMSQAPRKVAEFGNHKENGGIRVVVEIGDGLTPKGDARTINYTVGGTAMRGDDAENPKDYEDYFIDGCTSSTCSVKLPANRHSAVITIYVNNEDGLDEDDETIIITLQNGNGYTVNKDKRTTTVTITDDDTRGLMFHRTWPDVGEGESETHTLKLSSQPTAAVTVKIVSNNQDVTVSPTSLTFNPSGSNLWSTKQEVTVSAAQDDDAVDDTATLTYTTSGGDYGGANALSIDRPVSVDDDDISTTTGPQLPRISLTGGGAVTEGTAASFTVNADRAPTARLTVNVEVTERSGQDFVAASHEGVRTVTLNAGATSTTFTVPTVDDNTEENDGDVQVSVNDGTGYLAGSGTAVTVRDNDQPAASFSSGSSIELEDVGTPNVTVNLSSAAPSGGLTLNYSVAGTATAGGSNDFTIQNSGTLSIPAGATSATIPVAIIDDSAIENAETVILTLTSGTGYTVGSPSVHTLTIMDNDSTSAQPSVSFDLASSSATENAGTHNVTVTIFPAPSSGFTLGYSVTGTATAGSGNDFTIQSSGSLSVTAGTTSAVIPVAINDDNVDDDNETVILTFTDGTGYTVGSPTVHTLTITDNDGTGPQAVSFASASSSAAESAGTHDVTVNLSSAAPSGGLTLGYSVTGTATAGSGNDFTIQGSGTVTVAAGANTATIPVVINDDSTNENIETVILTLTGGTGYTLGSPVVHTLTITDNDGGQPPPIQPRITIRADIASVEEGTPAGFTVLASPAPTSDLTISLRVSETTAEGQDYIAISDEGTQTIMLHADATSARYTVPTEDDSTEEPDGRATVVVESGTDYSVSSTSDSASVTITDNDSHEISFASDTGRIREGGVHTIAVHIDPAPTSPLTLRYRLSGTATLEEDYRVQTPGMVQVPAGKSQALIMIESIADEVDESRETVVLTLDPGQGVSLGTPSTHKLTLIDAREISLEAGWSWLVRFGRTVAQQVVDSISQRLRATRTEGTQVNVAGAQLPVGQSRAFGTFKPPTIDWPFDYDTHRQTSAQSSTRSVSERELVQSSSFMSGSETDADGGNLVVWGQVSHSSFEGRDKDLSLDGDSTSVMLGADYAQQYWQAGATLIQSEGKGEYRDEVISGDAEASITSIVPWAAVQATERVQLWGALGTGDGDLELTEEDSDTLKTNIDWSMAAAGLRSVLVPASGQNGLQLSLVGDALWVETKADPIEGLSIADAQASRLRIGLEGEYTSELASDAEIISRLEFGIREDRGDAETGGGIEIGGGIAWHDARQGLRIELAGRKLLSYDNDELEDEGISLSFDYDPAPNTEEGLSVSLHQEIGVRSKGGLEALFDSEPLATRTDGEKDNRVRLEAAYGVPVLGGRFIGSPHMGLGLATGSREYSLGWKVTPERHAPDLSFGVRATRTESDALVPAHAIRFETVFRW